MSTFQNSDEPTADQYEMYRLNKCVGMSQTKLAARFQISQPSVSNYVRKVEEWLRGEQREEVALLRTRMTARLEHVYVEAMQAWEQSKEPEVVKTVKVETAGESTTTRTTPQTGQAAYLRLAMDSLDQMQGIWGTDMANSERRGELRSVGLTQIQLIEQQLKRLTDTRDGLLARGLGQVSTPPAISSTLNRA